jgi:hypothetical protein
LRLKIAVLPNFKALLLLNIFLKSKREVCSNLALVVSLPPAVELARSFRGTERKLLGREELLAAGALLLRVARPRLASHRVAQRLVKKDVTILVVQSQKTDLFRKSESVTKKKQ